MSKTVEEPNAYQPKRKMSWLVLFTRVAFNGTSSQESTPDISVVSLIIFNRFQQYLK